jgi:hypothetical protein
MAYSDTLELVQGDTLPRVVVTLKDASEAETGQTLDPEDSSTWAPIDLNGATVRLRIREIGASTVKATLTMTVTDAENGIASTDFPTGTLDTAGVFEAEIEATFQGGEVQTVNDLLKLKVREAFG